MEHHLCEGSLLHRLEGTTVSRVIRRCQTAVYRIWLKGMTGTYPTHAYLKQVGLAKSPDCPYCEMGVPATLTHFACVCPQFREAQTSAHNQVRQVVSSFLALFLSLNLFNRGRQPASWNWCPAHRAGLDFDQLPTHPLLQ